jgi:hypothetical protein
MITYEYYLALVGEARSYSTAEMFIGEIGFPADEPLEADDFVKKLQIIYTVANGEFKGLVKLTGLNLAKFARLYNIKYRTAQDWFYGQRPNNECINQFIGYAMIGEIYAKASKEN